MLLQILVMGGQAKKLEQVLQTLGPLGELLKGGGGGGASTLDAVNRPNKKRKRKRKPRNGALATSPVPGAAPTQPLPADTAKGKGKGKDREATLKGAGKGRGGAQAAVPQPLRAPRVEQTSPSLKKDDWVGDLVPYEELADYKGSGPVVVHVKDKEQAEAAGSILQQVAPKVSSTCVWIDGQGTCELPFYHKGSVAPRRGRVH